MSPASKFLIGLAAVGGMTWVAHGPMGNGAALVDRLEAEATAVVAKTEIPGIQVHLGRNPLSRHATLSGNADAFQRNGQGELKGLTQLVDDVKGISSVSWADEAPKEETPLLLEVMIQAVLAYLLGLGVAYLLWGRPKREGFL